MSHPLTVTDTNFKQEVLDFDVPVLVDFWASWCSPCKMIAPIVEELAGEYEGRVKVAKVDVDANPITPGHVRDHEHPHPHGLPRRQGRGADRRLPAQAVAQGQAGRRPRRLERPPVAGRGGGRQCLGQSRAEGARSSPASRVDLLAPGTFPLALMPGHPGLRRSAAPRAPPRPRRGNQPRPRPHRVPPSPAAASNPEADARSGARARSPASRRGRRRRAARPVAGAAKNTSSVSGRSAASMSSSSLSAIAPKTATVR